MKILFFALSVLALFNHSKADETIRLGGYLESSINYFDGKNEVTSSNALFRLEGNYDIKNRGKIESHLLYRYDMKPLDPFHTFKDVSIYSEIINKYYQEMYDGLEMEERIIADRLLEIYSSGYFDHLSYSSFYPKETIVLDRALIKLFYSSFDITFGKQQIAWGTGYAFNPTDVWNIKDPTAPDASKIGVLAVNLAFFFGDNSSLQIITSPGSDFDHWKYGARIKSTAGRFEYSFSGIRDKTDDGELLGVPEKIQIGADLSGEIFNEIGYRFEGAFINPRYHGMEALDADSSYIQLTTGFDYTFGSGLYLLTEYYYNGLGERQSSDYDISSFLRLTGGEMSGLAQNYAAVAMSYTIKNDYILSIVSVCNIDDSSAVFVPEIEYSFDENISVKLGTDIFAGSSERSEFGGIFNSVSLTVTGFF